VLGGWLPHRLPTTLSGVALFWRAPVEHRGGAWLKRGLPTLEVALPTSPDTTTCTARRTNVGPVIIGMDPHKRSATIEVIDQHEAVLATGRFGTDQDNYHRLLAAGRTYPQRVWAVEGCQGIGRHLAQRLVADGETVVDVPAKLSASSNRHRQTPSPPGAPHDPSATAEVRHQSVDPLSRPHRPRS
jgi:hypothetical protein